MKKNAQNNAETNPTTNATAGNETVEVLYQKMGDRWFAFSMIDDEIFMGSISQEEIDVAEKIKNAANGKTDVYKISGNT